MDQIKRSRSSNTDDDDDNSKRQKISITTVETNCLTSESISAFENLSNELMYDIFEFLDLRHAFEAFYDLNERFRNLFDNSDLPIKINISSISKSTFQHYLTHIIAPQTDRIKSLQLSNPFVANMVLLLFFPMMTNLSRLETLVLNNIESDHINGIINRLCDLPTLTSLTITSIDYTKNQNDIYQKIFRLPTLKYCQMLIETLRHLKPMSIATNDFSCIEHLVINNKVSLNQLHNLLSYVPQLRRLSLGHLDGRFSSRIPMSSINLNSLTNVSLKLFSVSFNHFEPLVANFFRQVQVLRLTVCPTWFSSSDMAYLDADRWERLISNHMPNLCVFDFEHQHSGGYNNDDSQAYKAQVHNFNSLFWIKRQWFFEYQNRPRNGAIFYSIDPYRRRYYMLYEVTNRNTCSPRLETNEDPVHHVYIHSTSAMEKFVSSFPNATELTLSETFATPGDSIVTSLNRIIPLRQLSKLELACHYFPFEQVIELLHLTANVHTLKLYSIRLYQTDYISIRQNEIFRIVSNTNTITNVTIVHESTLEQIQLLVALFPRLEYLTINLYNKDLESIARFLLSKHDHNTRYLSSLCITKQRRELVENLRALIESEKLLHDFTIKVINRKLYLWW